MDDVAVVGERYGTLKPYLDELQRRLLLGFEAARLGRGGVAAVAAATGAAPRTVSRGVEDLSRPPSGRVRKPGGGRKPASVKGPGVVAALKLLVEPDTAGDPMRPLLWTTKSTRVLAQELSEAGHLVSATTVRHLLAQEGYSLQANVKTIEKGATHPDRDAQFRHINDLVACYAATGCPVISIDTKKKELVGLYKNPGRSWSPVGTPLLVSGHDFPAGVDKAIPYGVYDVIANQGWVSVGMDHDTAAFAANTIRSWWDEMGHHRYPGATRLLICADGGGSNSSHSHAWKIEVAKLAADTGLAITVCHLPPGTSKWNKIEHRMFAFISKNWAARPLTSYQVILDLINATTTSSGLVIHARLDTADYPTGTTHTKADIQAIPITGDDFHPEWNYTINPPRDTPGHTQN